MLQRQKPALNMAVNAARIRPDASSSVIYAASVFSTSARCPCSLRGYQPAVGPDLNRGPTSDSSELGSGKRHVC
ncbi:hypothetical protein XA68_11994 [Ophiocordyceps unilateralis]|uniref:Uncharacterized protein n=1 Tax=Ophiocordyceps unilateralis TaxID=268505 RepID=A0A2A9PNZ5_OPHUN|nr:hypothetical protein XA68_11994 [Ophiocordyceps unilateralis]